MGYTPDKQPIIGEAPDQPGLWICAGFHGHGENTYFHNGGSLTIYRYGAHLSICPGVGAASNGKRERG